MKPVAACLAAAQQEADRFHRAAAEAPPRRGGGAWLAAAALLGVGAWAAAASLPRADTAAMPTPPRVEPHHPAALFAPPAPAGEAIAMPVAALKVAPPLAAPVPPLAAPIARQRERIERIERDGDEIVIDVAGLPLAAAAARLAALTGSAVIAGPAALDAARAPARRWRGHDVGAAWRALLADDASYALRCDARRCTVWLAASPASVAAGGARIARDAVHPAMPVLPSAGTPAERAVMLPAAPSPSQ